MPRGLNIVRMEGRVFGRFTVIDRAPNIGKIVAWNCRCECGKIKAVRGTVLRNGETTSCGCFRQECAGRINRRHSMSNTPTYYSWSNMIQRCTNPKLKQWDDY